MCNCESDLYDNPDMPGCDCYKINSNVHQCDCPQGFDLLRRVNPPARPQELTMFSYNQVPPSERHDYLAVPGMSSGDMVSNENPFRRPFDHHDYETVPAHDRNDYLELPVMNWESPKASRQERISDFSRDFGDGTFGRRPGGDERTSDNEPLLPFHPIDWNEWAKG